MIKDIRSGLIRSLRTAAVNYPRTAVIAKKILLPLYKRILKSEINRKYDIISTRDRDEASNNIKFLPPLSEATCQAADAAFHKLIMEDLKPGGWSAFGKKILMVVVSRLDIDPRVQREAEALVDAGWDVTVLCPDYTEGSPDTIFIPWNPAIRIVICGWTAGTFIGTRQSLIGGELFMRAKDLASETPFFAIHAHDLFTAGIGLVLASEVGCHCVVDFHEWTSENVHWDAKQNCYAPYPAPWKRELQDFENRVMLLASEVITVCDSIAEAIASELGGGRKPVVIRNIPQLSQETTRDYPTLKQQLGLPDNQFVLLWQGGTGTTRLIEPIIAALEFAPRCTFVIRGPSLEHFGDGYREAAAQAGASNRLILCDPVPSSDVVAAGRGADAGVWTLPNLCRNFSYALPNKIFEYTAANLALLVADYPEAKRIVEIHNIGLTFDPYDPQSIGAAINRLIDEPGLVKQFRENTHSALKTLDAQREWCKLVNIYEMLPETRVEDKKI